MLEQLSQVAAHASDRNGIKASRLRVELDKEDSQTLLLTYPSSTGSDAYIDKRVKIESGAKSALDPNSVRAIAPYVADDIPDTDLTVTNVTIVDADRTFWDKVVILHGLRRWFESKGVLKGGGHRISRHYYDLHQLMQSDTGRHALANPALGADCVAHAQMFFNRPAFDLASAKPSSFALVPEGDMYDDLRRDYAAMSGMIFGAAPRFEDVVDSIAELQSIVNAT